jgi:hypothetical protein
MNGYGILCFYHRGLRAPRNIRAHRLACELALHGPIPHRLWALHKCNTPLCCHYHPAHIYLGTPRDNMRDTVTSHRHWTQVRKAQRQEALRAYELLLSS